ncbi:MAG TPA: RsmB/NOP family class I SAM-dependent RNA methyltransferase, partial [Myxococcota bacterium]|nr:RsmB/NOP family class I SAM-dependent RNA methyltransferase [Myxococcota bacterium]
TPKDLVGWVNPLRPSPDLHARLTAAGTTLNRLELTPPDTQPSGEALLIEGLPREALTRDGPLSDLLERGHLYLINPASLLPPIALAPEPGDQVLDLCAAPGGKSIQLAARLFVGEQADQSLGHLAAVEAVKPRFFKLKALLERYGAPTDHRVRLFMKDGRDVGGAVPERFDRVLIDAPCSSEARFSADDESSIEHWNPRKLAECSFKQRGLLRSGLESLKVGGTLVYSTCSFAIEENEAVVADVLAACDGAVEVAPVAFPDTVPAMAGVQYPEVFGATRVLPDRTWDGFFLVRLVKRASLPDRPGTPTRKDRPGRHERPEAKRRPRR